MLCCEELAAALGRHHQVTGLPEFPDAEPWVVAEIIKAYYRSQSRNEVHDVGAEIPVSMAGPYWTNYVRLDGHLRRTALGCRQQSISSCNVAKPTLVSGFCVSCSTVCLHGQ